MSLHTKNVLLIPWKYWIYDLSHNLGTFEQISRGACGALTIVGVITPVPTYFPNMTFYIKTCHYKKNMNLRKFFFEMALVG